MEGLLGIGGVVVVVALFGLLSRIEAGRRRRMIQDVTRTTPVRRFDLSGDLLPREETSLGPVDYRHIPTAQPVGYIQTTQQARHAPTLESSVMVPALTAVCTTAALTLSATVLALSFGWSLRVVALTFAASLVLSWLWRLGFADKVLWSVESWTGRDINGDGRAGNPALGFATINPSVARAAVAHETAQNDAQTRTEALQTFVDRCYRSGTSETSHGITASGPDRENYVVCRDTLMRLGLAQWKNPNRPRGGWVMTTDPATCKGIVSNHVA